MGTTTLSARADRPVYDSARRPPPFWEELVDSWRYRDLVLQLVARDIKVRYKRSVLGIAWTMVNPMMMMVVLTLVFSHLFRFDLPHYPVYLLSATLLWNFFAQSTAVTATQMVWGGSLFARIYVPKTVFALSTVGSGLVNLLIALVPLAGVMVATGVPFTPALLSLPAAVLLAAMFTLGIGLLVASIGVSFPDAVEMYQIALSALYFLTPVMYPKTIIPEAYRWWLNLNPVYHLVEIFRWPIHSGALAGPNTWMAATEAACVSLALGWLVFSWRADRIVYMQ